MDRNQKTSSLIPPTKEVRMRRIILLVAVIAVTAAVVLAAGTADDARRPELQPARPMPKLPRPAIDYSHSFAPMAIDTIPPWAPYLNKPVYKAGDTYYDMQHNTTKGRMIAVDPEGGVHFAWMDGLDPGSTSRVVKYNYFHIDSVGTTDHPTGWLCGGDGVRVDHRDRAGYTTISIDDEHTVPTVSFHDQEYGSEFGTNIGIDGVYYMMGGDMRCSFITPEPPIEPYYHPDDTTFDCVVIWPKIAQIDTSLWLLSTVSNDTYHVAGEEVGSRLIYYRGYIKPIWGDYSEMIFEPPVEIEDDQIGITADISSYVGTTGNRLAMAYIRHDTVAYNDACYCTTLSPDGYTYYATIFDAAAIMIRYSEDMGESWTTPDTITPDHIAHVNKAYYDSLYRGWYLDTTVTPPETVDVYYAVYDRPTDLNITFDPNGFAHVVWSAVLLTPYEGWEFACEAPCSSAALCVSMICHWSERTGDIDTVVLDPIWQGACPSNSGLSHIGYSQEPEISIDDDGNIFVFWEQIHSEYWWCEEESLQLDWSDDGYSNSEIYCAVYCPDSSFWSDPFIISNTFTPACSAYACSSEIDITLAERIDDYVHLSFILDTEAGLWPYEEPEGAPATLCDAMYWRMGKDELMHYAYSGDTLYDYIEENWVTTPKTFRLGRNWPNPFNAATAFWFDVHTPGHYTIDVIDMTGRTVSKIAEHDLNTGRHIYFWEGYSDNGWFVPSGVYFLRARDDKGNSVSRKITLIK